MMMVVLGMIQQIQIEHAKTTQKMVNPIHHHHLHPQPHHPLYHHYHHLGPLALASVVTAVQAEEVAVLTVVHSISSHFIHSFIHSSIHSFIQPSMQPSIQ